MRLNVDLPGQFAIAQNLEPGIQLLHDTTCDERLGSKGVTLELLKQSYIDDCVFFAENVGKPALRKPPMQRHLAAFETAHFAVSRNRLCAFCTATRVLTAARAHTLADAPFSMFLALGRPQIR